MKTKIKEAVEQLKFSVAEEKKITFNHSNPFIKTKSVKVDVISGVDNTIQVKLSNIKGYSPRYIRNLAKSSLKAALYSDLRVGDIVWMNANDPAIDYPMTVNSNYPLPQGANYFGVGRSPRLHCGGWKFYNRIEARFKGTERASCQPGWVDSYKLFEIVRL